MLILPESPRYLLMRGKEDKAQAAIAKIMGRPIDSPEVNEEYAEIAANLHHERAVGATSYLACFKMGPGKNAQRVLTGMGIQALQQLTGINFIIYVSRQRRVLDALLTLWRPTVRHNLLHPRRLGQPLRDPNHRQRRQLCHDPAWHVGH